MSNRLDGGGRYSVTLQEYSSTVHFEATLKRADVTSDERLVTTWSNGVVLSIDLSERSRLQTNRIPERVMVCP
jgi:hypothetical protein